MRPSIKEAQISELNALPPHMRYVFLGKDDTFPVIIALNFNVNQVEFLVEVLKRFKRAIGWTIANILVFHPMLFTQNTTHAQS